MSAAQRRSYDTLRERFCVTEGSGGEFDLLDFARVFGNGNPVVVEIGFGMGEALAALACANSGVNYLGIEVHRPGVGRLLWEIEKRGIKNIRVIEDDAVDAMRRVRDGSLAGVHLFFPDPWPKKKHRKRRLVARPFTSLLAAKLAPGGCLYMVTDWEDYGSGAMAELSATPGLANPYRGLPGGFAPPRPWRPRTRFEEKGLAQNHAIRELWFVKE
jgi:tRNA (guanine-N7-)-methyltransferase